MLSINLELIERIIRYIMNASRMTKASIKPICLLGYKQKIEI